LASDSPPNTKSDNDILKLRLRGLLLRRGRGLLVQIDLARPLAVAEEDYLHRQVVPVSSRERRRQSQQSRDLLFVLATEGVTDQVRGHVLVLDDEPLGGVGGYAPLLQTDGRLLAVSALVTRLLDGQGGLLGSKELGPGRVELRRAAGLALNPFADETNDLFVGQHLPQAVGGI